MAYNVPTSANYPNDVYYQLENLDKLLSTDYMFYQGSYLDYTLNPVNKNILTNKLEYTGNPIDVVNSTLINNYYINQYAKEYKGIIDDVITNNSTSALSQFDLEYIKGFENYILKLVNKLSAMKGTFYLIELVVLIYCKFLGKELLSFLEDPTKPFVYRITTTLDSSVWENNIKKLVHPMGWYDNFNLVDSIISDRSVQNFDHRLRNFKLKTLSYLDAENYFLNHSPTAINQSTFGYNQDSVNYNPNITAGYFPPATEDYFGNLRYLYLTDGNVNVDNVRKVTQLGRYGATFSNVFKQNHRKFNIHPSLGLAVNDIASAADYDVKEDVTFLNNKNIQYNYYSSPTSARIDFVYPKPGYALIYKWDVYLNNVLCKSDLQYFNTYSIDLKALEKQYGKNVYKDVAIELTLMYHNYKKKAFRYDLSAFIPMKGLRDTAESRFMSRSYIGIRMKTLLQHSFSGSGAVNPPPMNYQDISLNSFLSEAKNDTISYMTYTRGGNKVNSLVYSNALTADLVAPNNIYCSIDGIKYNLTFKPFLTSSNSPLYPLITNYRWNLYYKGNLLYTKTSNQKSIELVLSTTTGGVDVSNYKLELFVKLNNNDNIEYQVDTTTFNFTTKG